MSTAIRLEGTALDSEKNLEIPAQIHLALLVQKEESLALLELEVMNYSLSNFIKYDQTTPQLALICSADVFN